ncbi:MAG TPA: hypothetical protein VKR31_00805 [Rhizomicrobium sp.]|nr:hypothetical protein [Rhizomicrobium sp.]
MERARSRSIFIATPIARHPVRQYTTALHLTCVMLAGLGIRAWVQNTVGASNLPRARNDLVAAFLASDYDDLLFIDDDMGWNPGDVIRLMASEQAVIGGVGCKKTLLADTAKEKWCFRALKGGRFVQDDFGAIEVEAVGTGFLKISREVFETMKAAHPDWKRNGWHDTPAEHKPHCYRFFAFDPDDPEEKGEDIAFCMEWRRLGGRVFIDPTIRLVHVGEMEFTGDFTALLEPAPQYREAAE